MSRRATDTQRDALAALNPNSVRNQCDRIEAAIRSAGHGLTILEISKRTGIVSSTVSARLATLRKQGRVCESVIRRKCTVNGMRKKLWVEADDSGQMTLGRTA
jgi:predicted transcriptional regulator